MIGYVASIEELTKANTDFRRVLYSVAKLQLVLMSVAPGEELDGGIHAEADQFFPIEKGKGRTIANGAPHKVKPGDCAVVPAGAYVNLFCTGPRAGCGWGSADSTDNTDVHQYELNRSGASSAQPITRLTPWLLCSGNATAAFRAKA